MFNGEYAICHYQYAQMVDILIKQSNLNMRRLNPNVSPCKPQIVIEEEKELKKEKQKNSEEIKRQQYSVIKNIEAVENRWKVPSRKVQ